jgi:hypothetical protein
METEIKKVANQQMIIDISLHTFKDRDLFPKKTKKFNQMVNKIGEENFAKLTGESNRDKISSP